MLLVPKQLQRVGMTGNVPYYGGRFSPAQAYGASHPTAPPPSFADPMTAGGAFVRAPVPTTGQSAAPASPTRNQSDTPAALQHLLDSGVISQAEFQQLRARVTQ
ncbi:MAG TPA: SHOCT domain-containing protein [Propionibacteriaceae bacterium]